MTIPRSYIHTYSASLFKPKKKFYYEDAIFNQSKTGLISLISGLQNTNFGLNTLSSVIKTINNIKRSFLQDSELFIDSGGYSIIAGDVKPIDIAKFINCYITYLEYERDNYDYIFSLDIPVFLKFPASNTVSNIYNLNKRSLQESIKILQKYPELQNKFIFVWQFKIWKQYKIWDKLYDELELTKYVNKQAIGGMVGLIGLCKLSFAPFIAPAYRCLYNYVNNQRFEEPFYLHLLGVYHKSSRIILYLLQDLFSIYLHQYNPAPIRITFDTINYFLTSQFKSRDKFKTYHFENNELKIYNSFFDVPMDIIKNIYYTPELLQNFQENLEDIKNKKRLKDVNFCSPLYLYSELNYDNFLKYISDHYNFIELLNEAKNINQFSHLLNYITLNMKIDFPIITNDFIKTLKENLRIIYYFHTWFKTDFTKKKLDIYLEQFIKKIQFPGDLN